MEYSGLLELSAIAFTLLFAFPNLFINLEDRTKEAWILNFYRFIATKLLVPSVAYLSSAFLILLCVYTGLEFIGEISLLLLIMTTFGFLCFVIVALSYAFVKVMIERSVEREVLSKKKRSRLPLKQKKNDVSKHLV